MKKTLLALIIITAISVLTLASCVKRTPTEPGYPTATPTPNRQVLYIDLDNEEAALTDLHCVDTLTTSVPGIYSISGVADNGRYAYSDANRIYTQDPDGTGNTQLTYGLASQYDYSPDISADGAKIVYSGYITGDGYEICKVYTDCSGNTVMTSGPANSYGPKWSPDGTKIAYVTDNQIQVMNEDGTNSRTVSTAGIDVYNLDWSPDGTKIVFTCYDSGNSDFRICFISSTGAGVITTLMSGPNSSGNINWIAAYNKIYYDSSASGNISIYRMNPDGSDNVLAIDPGSDVTFDYWWYD